MRKRMLRGVSLIAFWVVLSTALVAGFPTRLCGQAASSRSQSKPHELKPQMTSFGNYSKDFREMQKALHGEELQVVEFLDEVATTAEDRLYAANAMLRMYDNISCKPDRVKVRGILRDQLEYYSWQMENEAGRVTGSLALSKVPAAAQIGLRMKDDLRAAKIKLDAIAGSLD
jgi:hypothetical protein